MSKAFRFITGVFVAFSLLMVTCTSCNQAPPPAPKPRPVSDKLSEIMARGRIIIATSPDYPPQSEFKPGVARIANTKCAPTEYTSVQVAGFDVDVAVEIARRLGVEACFITPPLNQVFSGNWAERWDIAVASVSITSERTRELYFAQPYSSSPEVFYVHRDNRTFSNHSDLSGRRIGVCAGCVYEAYLERTLSLPGQKIGFPVSNARIVAYQIETDSLADLALKGGKKLDAAMTSVFVGQSAIKRGLPIKQLGGPAFIDYTAAVIDRKSGRDPVSFVKKISDITLQMHADGTLLRLSNQYYGQDFTTAAGKFDINILHQFP